MFIQLAAYAVLYQQLKLLPLTQQPHRSESKRINSPIKRMDLSCLFDRVLFKFSITHAELISADFDASFTLL